MSYRLVIFFLFIPLNFLSSQTLLVQEDTLSLSNTIKTDFNNDINVSNLFSYINYQNTFDRFRVSINNRFNSNVSKLQQKFFRDYDETKAVVNYIINDKIESGAGIIYSSFSDNRNIGINENKNMFVFSNTDYKPFQELDLNLKAGFTADNQVGEENTGVKGMFNSNLKSFVFDNYISNGRMQLMYENLTKKLNYNAEVSGELFRQFEGFADNRGYIKVFNRRTDLYFPATSDVREIYNVNNNTESRIETFIGLEDKLNYLLNENLVFSISGLYYTRQLNRDIKYKTFSNVVIIDNSYDSKINESNLGIDPALEYFGDKILLRGRLQYTERSETHNPLGLENYTQAQARELTRIERNKNNLGKRTSLYLDSYYQLTNTHYLKVMGSYSLFKYDTDSDENFDDRDEIYFVGSFAHKYSNLNNFEIETTFDVSRSHLKYIFQERSSNNNVNNIYKLTSNSYFAPFKNFVTKNIISVLANYTVYDFEDLLSQTQSFSYRQLYVKDSTSYNFIKPMYLNLIGEVKYSEQGEFFNDEFSVNPLTYYEDKNFIVELFYKLFENLIISGGYKYFEQKRFDYASGTKELKNTIINAGPLANLRLYLNNFSFVKFTYSLDNYRYSESSLNNSSSSFILNVQWNL